MIEQNAVALGVSIDLLMENAGRAVAEEAARHLPPAPGRVAIIAGTGNNGGDGFAAAFYLGQWGYSPEIWLIKPPQEIRSLPARRCFERAVARFPVQFRSPTPAELEDIPLVIDAMLGTGQHGELRSPYREAVGAIRASRAPTLSIDEPTGLGDTKGLRPKFTVALTAAKVGMDSANSGEIAVRSIGIPSEARWQTGPGEFLRYPTPSSRARRGRDGRALVIGGGPYSGAPGLAALAVLRAGGERATVITPRPAADHVQGFSPNLIVVGVGEGHFQRRDVPSIRDWIRNTPVRAVVLGMGAGRDPETIEALREVIVSLRGKIRMVVDADGLSALELNPKSERRFDPSDLVATPNQGEFQRVFGLEGKVTLFERMEEVRQCAKSHRISLLVKGAADLISDGSEAFANLNHHPSMTVGGMGDVLAGVVGSLIAQGLSILPACRLGSYWVGEAGQHVAQSRGFGLMATDVLEELPAALVAGVRRVRAIE